MKKNVCIYVMVFVLTSCQGWGWMEPEPKEQIETDTGSQTIKGANDCETSTVSWANGEATANGWYNESFSFVVKTNGNLSFQYRCGRDASVTITDNGKVLTRLNYSQYYGCVDCGSVSTGDRIIFKSASGFNNSNCYVYIKNIVIKAED